MDFSAVPPRLLDAGDREAGVLCAHCCKEVTRGSAVAQCQRCATVHHRWCWDAAGGCGSYNCAPARRAAAAATPAAGPTWSISAEELETAIPLPPPRPPFTPAPGATFAAPSFPPGMPPPAPASNRVNRVAIAALVVAIVGIPVVGLVTGVFAIILACIALSSIQRTRSRGTGVAVSGLLLGFADIIAWTFLIVMWTGGGGHSGRMLRPPQMELDPAVLQSVEPHIADAMRANVVISSEGTFGGERLGSGVVVKLENGVASIVTNRHVIDASYSDETSSPAAPKSSTILVHMLGQPPAEGRIAWVAPPGVDLAIVTVPCGSREVRAAKYPAEHPPRLGDQAFAVGNPHALGWSLSPGVVSQVRTWHPGAQELTVIQTTAPINSGNSGGGLYDKDGAVVGINTWTEDKQVSEGIGFAISFENLLRLAPSQYLHNDSTTSGAPTRAGARR